MHTFISGGCKNGKSFYAQRVAKAGGTPLYYVATMISTGAEDDARIARHIGEREGWGFETVECGRDILSILDRTDPDGCYLLDSVTALLANEMFPEGRFDPSAGKRVAEDLCSFVHRTRHAVFVSDFIYSDIGLFDEWTEVYRRALAYTDRSLAAVCENVLEVSFGSVNVLKGVAPL